MCRDDRCKIKSPENLLAHLHSKYICIAMLLLNGTQINYLLIILLYNSNNGIQQADEGKLIRTFDGSPSSTTRIIIY